MHEHLECTRPSLHRPFLPELKVDARAMSYDMAHRGCPSSTADKGHVKQLSYSQQERACGELGLGQTQVS